MAWVRKGASMIFLQIRGGGYFKMKLFTWRRYLTGVKGR